MQTSNPAARTIPWDDIRLFLALSRARTVGEAARSLSVDASTVSRRLVTLEASLGTTLFDRGRDGVSATKAAEDLLLAAEEIELGVARFTREVEGLEREVAGVVRITCPPDVADVVVAPLLPALIAAHPRLRIALQATESLLDLTRREADVALRVVRPAAGNLQIVKALATRWTVAGAAALTRRLGTLKRWSDAPWIGWGPRYAGIPAARWLAKHGGKLQPVLTSDSLTSQIAAARAGLGVMLVPEKSARHYDLLNVKIGRALRPSAKAWPQNDLYLLTHRALRRVPRVRVVWDALLERCREL